MPKYRTIVDGMNGTGAPVIAGAAPEIPEGKDAQQAEAPTTGATVFGGMRVTGDIRRQIEQGSAADFFYFEEAQDEAGKYDMHPKLPELGCAGPGEPVFKLRENNNRLMKGFAQKFIGEDGEPDIEKGMRFLSEWNLRFGISTESVPYSPEMPMETDMSVLKENANNWLCEELNIPDEERDDFKNYLDATMSFYMDQKAINLSNTYKLWQGFARNYNALQQMQTDPESPYYGDKGQNDPQYQLNLKKAENAKNELKRLVQIDPAAEKKMIAPTECSGSRSSNMAYVQLSDNAQVELNQKKKEDVRKDPFFVIDIKNELVHRKNAPERIKSDIDTLAGDMEKEKDPEKRTQMQQRMTVLAAQYGEAVQDAKNLPKEADLKWEYHQSPVLGSFKTVQDGKEKKFYLTAEAFAPETDVLMEHPAVTDSVAVGIYSDVEDFRRFYRKDPLTISNKYSAEMAKNKEEYGGTEFEKLLGQEDKYREIPLKQIEERKKYNQVITAAKEALGDSAKEMTPAQSAFAQQLSFLRDERGTVPEEHKADYEKLIMMSSQLLAKSTALEYNRRIQDKATELLPTNEEKSDFNALFRMSKGYVKRPNEAMRVLEFAIRSIQDGRDDFSLQGMNEQDAASFQAFLRDKGMDPDNFVAVVNAAGTGMARNMAGNEQTYDFQANGKADKELLGFMQALAYANNDPEFNRAGGPEIDFKAETGLMALNKLVGADLHNGPGGPDLRRMEAAMDRIVINGIPASYLMQDKLTKDNWKEAAAMIGDHVSSYLSESKNSDGTKYQETRAEHVGILDKGKIVPLTFTPPEPIPPVTKTNFFSRSKTVNKRRLEEQRYRNDLARKEYWQKRNEQARMECGVFEKLREPQAKDHNVSQRDISFEELVRDLKKNNTAAAKESGSRQAVNGSLQMTGSSKKTAAVNNGNRTTVRTGP